MVKRKPGTTLVDGVHLALRESVISGQREPGNRISISGLAAEHGVSLGVVREAMARLVADGLATSSAMLGFRVIDISAKDLQDLHEVRLLILAEATRQSVANGDATWEARLREAQSHFGERAYKETLTPELVREVSLSAFHLEQIIISACPNARLTSLFASTFQKLQIYHRLSVRLVIDDQTHILDEYTNMVNRCLVRDAEGVIKIMHQQAERINAVFIDYLIKRERDRAA